MKTGKVQLSLPGHTDSIHSLVFSPDGKTLASGSHDQTLKVWDTTTGREKLTIREKSWFLFAVPYSPPCIVFSPDGNTLASWGNIAISLWDVTTGKERLTLSDPDWCSEYIVESVAFSPDGKQLASLFGSTINVWEVENGRNLATFEEADRPHPLRHSLGNLGNRLVDTLPNAFEEYHDTLRSVFVSPDGRVMALGNGGTIGTHGVVKMWAVTTFPYKAK